MRTIITCSVIVFIACKTAMAENFSGSLTPATQPTLKECTKAIQRGTLLGQQKLLSYFYYDSYVFTITLAANATGEGYIRCARSKIDAIPFIDLGNAPPAKE